jgi:hypothetical protein
LRTFSAAALAALIDTVVRPFYLFSMVKRSSTTDPATYLYLTTLDHDISWNGQTWLGNGFLKNMGSVRETGDLSAEGLDVHLCGEPSALVSMHLSDIEQNNAANVYLGFLTEARAVIVDPVLLFTGKVDTSKLTDSISEATLTISLESVLVDFDRPKDLRYNHESQQSIYPGDLFFEYVEQLQNAHYYWGLKSRKNKRNKKDKKTGGSSGR